MHNSSKITRQLAIKQNTQFLPTVSNVWHNRTNMIQSCPSIIQLLMCKLEVNKFHRIIPVGRYHSIIDKDGQAQTYFELSTMTSRSFSEPSEPTRGGGWGSTNSYTGGPRGPTDPFIYHFLREKTFLQNTNGTPFTYLDEKFAALLITVSAL